MIYDLTVVQLWRVALRPKAKTWVNKEKQSIYTFTSQQHTFLTMITKFNAVPNPFMPKRVQCYMYVQHG